MVRDIQTRAETDSKVEFMELAFTDKYEDNSNTKLIVSVQAN